MNLYLKLRADRLDPIELTHVLSELNLVSQTTDDEVTFRREGEDWLLRLVYAGDILIRIDSGPAFRPEDVTNLRRRIDTEVLHSTKTVVGRSVCFAAYPVKGFFRVDDLVQLCPIPEHAPQAPFMMAEHPFVMEFRYAPSSSAWVAGTRRALAEEKARLLLNVVLAGGIRSKPQSPRHSWVLVEGDEPGRLRPQYLQNGYFFSPFATVAEDFSSQDVSPGIMEVTAEEYFGLHGYELGSELRVPDVARILVRAFYALPEADTARFLRAAFWYAYGHHRTPHSLSAFVVSMISAVEALIEKAGDAPKCGSCGKYTGPSVTQRFVDFVEHFAPASGKLDRARRDLYGLRSRLAHGDLLFRRDQEFGPVLHDENEWSAGRYSSYTARLVLINWLYARARLAA